MKNVGVSVGESVSAACKPLRRILSASREVASNGFEADTATRLGKSLALALALTWLGGCPHHGDNKPTPATKDDAAVPSDAVAVVLPPAPPLPEVPIGLPRRDPGTMTADHVAFGAMLFGDPSLSSTGTIACATCHDPAHGFAGTAHQVTADGKPNLRRAPALVNLDWVNEFGWDGRYNVDELLAAHVRGQMGNDMATLATRIAQTPTVHAHLQRLGEATPAAAQIELSLLAFVLTRYAGDSPWDRDERSGDAPADIKAGYQLFTGKAQCSVCHTPPLYTDLRYHRIGLIASKDDGRGKVDPAQAGAFRTPTLRGAANRTAFFHDGSATSLDAAIDWHLAGGVGQGADPSIVDPALKPVTLSPADRAKLGAFVRALSTP